MLIEVVVEPTTHARNDKFFEVMTQKDLLQIYQKMKILLWD
jgi:hypothetical protein